MAPELVIAAGQRMANTITAKQDHRAGQREEHEVEHATRSIWLGPIDVAAVIDQKPLSRVGWRVLIVCALIIAVDGFDVQAITYVAPVLTKALGVERASLGPVFSSGLFGTMAGALILAPLADQLGRKFVLCACILLFSLCTLATVTVTSIESLMILRFLAGLGLGSATPIAVAFAAEFSPARIRATCVMIVYTGFAVGAGGGGLIAAKLLPTYGWPSVFALGGVAPLVLLAALVLLLPRSLVDLARSNRGDLIAKTLTNVAPEVAVDPTAPVKLGDREAGFPVARLFTEGRATRTLVLWVMFFTNILSLYFMVSWFPTLANGAGLDVGSIASTLSLAALSRRFETFTIMSLGYLGGALVLVLVAYASGSVAYVTAVAFLAGFFVIGTQTGANAVSALVYPGSMRATGVGWALGMGRTGSILGPSLGGLLIAHGWDAHDLFLAAAGPVVLACICAILLSVMLREPSGQNEAAEVAR
jgi:MFS transporter, AAHS family, 4-hydroxybenzoate transporter